MILSCHCLLFHWYYITLRIGYLFCWCTIRYHSIHCSIGLYVSGNIRAFLQWSCKPDPNIDAECMTKSSSNFSCWQHYFYRGRTSKYSHLLPTENLLFKLAHRQQPNSLLKFFYGSEDNHWSGAKYFRCRAEVENRFGVVIGMDKPSGMPAPFPLKSIGFQTDASEYLCETLNL